MSDNTSNSIVSLGEIAKPADTLIKKISHAIGGIFAPYQLKRVAKAEAEAAVIKANSDVQVADIHRRAIKRFFEEEAIRQKNIENITAKAIPDLSPSAKPASMENDWIANFFDKCRIISNDDMQNLWARVLAGEANAPGSYSKRTVNFLSSLDKYEAERFTKLCSFCFDFNGLTPLVFDEKADIYKDNGINFSVLSNLDTIGLVKFNPLGELGRRTGIRESVTVRYFDKKATLTASKVLNNNQIPVGCVALTRSGEELAEISGRRPVDGFWEYVIAKWRKPLSGIKIRF